MPFFGIGTFFLPSGAAACIIIFYGTLNFPCRPARRAGGATRKEKNRGMRAERGRGAVDEGYGFIHDKLDIKLLILFVLRRLPAEIDGEALGDLVLIDGGINYFDYKECLAELARSAQVERGEAGYRVTAKGSRNGEILENGLPYSVRAKAERLLAPVAAEMRRDAMILANHELTADGGVLVYLALSDGVGNIFDLKILAAGEEQARRIEKNFRRDAEVYYQRFLALLEGERTP